MNEKRKTLPAPSSKEAILAALETIIEGGNLGALTATGLAREAGVSRRTIFNHFESLDEAVVEYCAQKILTLGNIILDHGEPSPTANAGDLFQNTATALLEADLADLIANFDQVIKGFSQRQTKTRQLSEQVFGQLSIDFRKRLTSKYPNVSVFDMRLTVGALFFAVSVCTRQWVEKYSPIPGKVSPEARRQWQETLQIAFARLSAGLAR